MGRAADGGGGSVVVEIDEPDRPIILLDQATIRRRLKLHQAAVRGDWTTARGIYEATPQEITAAITGRRETALHVATLAEKTEFVRNLVSKMNNRDLAPRDVDNNTAFCLAALTGKKEIAQIMIAKNPNLAIIRGRGGILPIHMAAFSGHREMVEFLSRKTDYDQLDHQDHRDLLVGLIDSDMFDIALEMIAADGGEYLVTLKDRYEETALCAIARKPHMLSIRQSSFDLGSKDVQKKKARELLRRIWERLVIMNESQILKVVGDGWRTIFIAVENGNVEFLRILIECYPDLVTKTNDEGHTIFHAAVLHRQEEIFELIHTIGSLKKVIAMFIDKNGNHMLHLAAQLAPSHRLESIPGEALQLQHELLWFQEVEGVVGSRLAQERNLLDNPRTPREIFIDKHQKMIKKGEACIRNTANSCIIVAVLVATVVFAAAYTVSGGTDQNTGYPMFLHDISFKIFAVADAVSFISSATSVLAFLSLLTSTYALDDFVYSIPVKLLLGLTTLFVSLASMMVAFVTAFFMYFKQHREFLKYAVPMAAVSFIPPFLFLWLHRHQFITMIKFTPYKPKHKRGTPGANLPQCPICIDYWLKDGRPSGDYLIVSRGGHIPGVPHPEPLDDSLARGEHEHEPQSEIDRIDGEIRLLRRQNDQVIAQLEATKKDIISEIQDL